MRKAALIPLAIVLLAACAPVQLSARRGTEAPQPAIPKHITVAINSSPAALSSQLTQQLGGTTDIESLTRGGLASWDPTGILRPQLGEAVPSIDNGLWKLFADGRMEITWHIKPSVFWHDGAPLTADDLAFTLAVARDKEVPFLGKLGSVGIDSVEAPDPRTLTVRWSQPFISADSLFAINGGNVLVLPLPKHLLEQTYVTDKPNFTQVPYWATEFVGAGPYRVNEFARDTHLRLEAFDQFVLGRPRIDEIEVKLIPDINAVIANLLSGSVDAILGRGLTFEQGRSLREQWNAGQVDFILSSVVIIYPQFLNPNPPVVGNAQFRRALLQAVNREELANALMGGVSPVAHGRVLPQAPEFTELQSAMVQYAFDPRRATELIEGLGYRKGTDARFRDSANQPLTVEVRSNPGEENTKPTLATVDYWQQVGVGVDTVVVPTQRQRDLEYRATFPAFELTGQPGALENIASLRSDVRAVPENNFQPPSGKNYARYSNPEMDALLDRYFMTVPAPERLGIAKEIFRRITDDAIWLTLYYTPRTTAIGNRLRNVQGANEPGTTGWNAQEWDLRS